MIDDDPKKVPFWKARLKRHVPILSWLPKYQKSDLVADAIAGITLGLTLVPQSVAYATLAGVPAEYGLYSSFMGGFIYFLFGTVKEVSVGPTSLISLLTFEFTRDLPIQFVFFFTFLCGCIEFLCGLFQFGFLVNFISTPVIASFQTAVSIIIIAAQFKDFFGVPKFKSGRFLNNLYNVAERLPEANWADIILSFSCCAFLVFLRQIKEIKFMKLKEPTKIQKLLKTIIWFISIGRNALCVVLSCTVAYMFARQGQLPFRLTGDVPSGLPPFNPPPLSIHVENRTLNFGEMIWEVSSGLLVVPLISILANVTIAKAFSSGTSVDATQEMLTLGICNISGSMFGSVPTCGAFTRSAVSNSSGVRTPLSGLFTSALMLLVITYLTPYFYFIPKATLASILICAVIFIIDFKTFWLLWKGNKKDFFCAMVTFVSCLLSGVQFGLILGILFSICTLLYMWARPSIHIEVMDTPKGSHYLIRPDVGLFFPANDFVRSKISNRCTRNIPIVIDCVHLKGVDYTSAQGIKDMVEHCKLKNRGLAFINMKENVYNILKSFKVQLNLKQIIPEEEDLKDVLFQPENPEKPFVVLFSDANPKCLNILEKGAEEKPLVPEESENK